MSTNFDLVLDVLFPIFRGEGGIKEGRTNQIMKKTSFMNSLQEDYSFMMLEINQTNEAKKS